MNLFSWKKNKERPAENVKDEFVAKPPEMISIIMQDGTTDKYPTNFHITDGKNAVICSGSSYHTHFDCKYLTDERSYSSNPIRAIYTWDADAQGIDKCYECATLDELFKE